MVFLHSQKEAAKILDTDFTLVIRIKEITAKDCKIIKSNC